MPSSAIGYTKAKGHASARPSHMEAMLYPPTIDPLRRAWLWLDQLPVEEPRCCQTACHLKPYPS